MVQAVAARREHAYLRPTLPAVLQKEGRVVDHCAGVVFGKRIGISLACAQRRAVLSGKQAHLALRDRHFRPPRIDAVEDVNERFDMKARRQDPGLRPVFAVCCHNPALGQRSAAIDAEQMRGITIRDMDVGSGCDGEDDDEYPKETQSWRPCPVTFWEQQRDGKGAAYPVDSGSSICSGAGGSAP